MPIPMTTRFFGLIQYLLTEHISYLQYKCYVYIGNFSHLPNATFTLAIFHIYLTNVTRNIFLQIVFTLDYVIRIKS